MNENIMFNFLEGAGHRPYRKLVQEQIKKLSTKKLQQAVLWECSNLPENMHDLVMNYIDETNKRFGNDKVFWESANCQRAFDEIIETAIEVLPLHERIASIDDALRPENQELAFQLFQITTLSFAYSASTQRAQRKFMGI
jgi:hypothetical protein